MFEPCLGMEQRRDHFVDTIDAPEIEEAPDDHQSNPRRAFVIDAWAAAIIDSFARNPPATAITTPGNPKFR